MKTDAEIMKAAKEAAINAAKPLPGLEAVHRNTSQVVEERIRQVKDWSRDLQERFNEDRLSPDHLSTLIGKVSRLQTELVKYQYEQQILKALREGR